MVKNILNPKRKKLEEKLQEKFIGNNEEENLTVAVGLKLSKKIDMEMKLELVMQFALKF